VNLINWLFLLRGLVKMGISSARPFGGSLNRVTYLVEEEQVIEHLRSAWQSAQHAADESRRRRQIQQDELDRKDIVRLRPNCGHWVWMTISWRYRGYTKEVDDLPQQFYMDGVNIWADDSPFSQCDPPIPMSDFEWPSGTKPNEYNKHDGALAKNNLNNMLTRARHLLSVLDQLNVPSDCAWISAAFDAQLSKIIFL
jgi:hypothetical protein